MFSYILADKEKVDAQLQEKLTTLFLERADIILKNIEADGFRDALTRYYRGCTGGIMALAHYLIEAYEISGNTAYRNGAESQLHYLLGINALDMSFVSKVGYVYPKHIHHAAMANDNVNDIYPGLVVGGPNSHLNADSILRSVFDENTPAALCYIDSVESYASNENCILYNAPLVAVTAYFSSFK